MGYQSYNDMKITGQIYNIVTFACCDMEQQICVYSWAVFIRDGSRKIGKILESNSVKCVILKLFKHQHDNHFYCEVKGN